MSKIAFRRVSVVFERDFKEFIGWKSFKIIITLLILISLVESIMINILLRQGETAHMETLIENMLFLMGIVPLIVSIPLFTTTPFTKEKNNGTISSLLSTQLKPSEICLGKSLAIFIPGFIATVISEIILVVGVVLTATIPSALLFDILIIVPVFFWGLTIWTVQLSMLNSPELAIAPSYLIGLVLFIGVPIASVMQMVDLSSWYFTRIAFVVAACMWIIIILFEPVLTKEKITLSR